MGVKQDGRRRERRRRPRTGQRSLRSVIHTFAWPRTTETAEGERTTVCDHGLCRSGRQCSDASWEAALDAGDSSDYYGGPPLGWREETGDCGAQFAALDADLCLAH